MVSAEQQRRDAEQAERRNREHVEAAMAKVRAVILDKPSVSSLMSAYFAELESKPLTVAGWPQPLSVRSSNWFCISTPM